MKFEIKNMSIGGTKSLNSSSTTYSLHVLRKQDSLRGSLVA